MKRSDLEQIIREEIEAALQEALPVRGDLTPGEPMKAKSPVAKQVEKIGSLSQIKQLVRRLPSRPAKDMADIIMTMIDIMDEKTGDVKSKLVTRELVYKLREKLRNQ